jgi:hypothetical protein
MIAKFAGASKEILSEFLDLNHTSNSMILVSLLITKLAPGPDIGHCEKSGISFCTAKGLPG